MREKTTFPFAVIARRHKVSYDVVIRAAECAYKGLIHIACQDNPALDADIISACSQHRAMQDGSRNWLEGYVI
jgi:hypothetical protein